MHILKAEIDQKVKIQSLQNCKKGNLEALIDWFHVKSEQQENAEISPLYCVKFSFSHTVERVHLKGLDEFTHFVKISFYFQANIMVRKHKFMLPKWTMDEFLKKIDKNSV